MADVEHVQRVYDASYQRLVGQLTVFTGSRAEAEDVVMEAFARAVTRARTFASTDNPEAWLRTVAINVARSRWRRLAHWRRLAPALQPRDDAHDPDLPEDRLALLEALRALPSTQREAIALHHLMDLPLAEVADLLDVPVGTVKARLSRGRVALAASLTESSSTAEERHA